MATSAPLSCSVKTRKGDRPDKNGNPVQFVTVRFSGAKNAVYGEKVEPDEFEGWMTTKFLMDALKNIPEGTTYITVKMAKSSREKITKLEDEISLLKAENARLKNGGSSKSEGTTPSAQEAEEAVS